MKNEQIYNFMIADRTDKINKNNDKILLLKDELDNDQTFISYSNKLSSLKTKKEELKQQLIEIERRFLYLKENNVISALAYRIQSNTEEIEAIEEKRVIASFIKEAESKKSHFPKILRIFYKYYKYRKKVNSEEIGEYISIFTELYPFIRIYNRVKEEADNLGNSTIKSKYSSLITLYNYVQKELIEETDKYEERYRKENHFIIANKSIKNQYRKNICEIENEERILEDLLEVIINRRNPLNEEIERLQNENNSFMSQIKKLTENLNEELVIKTEETSKGKSRKKHKR